MLFLLWWELLARSCIVHDVSINHTLLYCMYLFQASFASWVDYVWLLMRIKLWLKHECPSTFILIKIMWNYCNSYKAALIVYKVTWFYWANVYPCVTLCLFRGVLSLILVMSCLDVTWFSLVHPLCIIRAGTCCHVLYMCHLISLLHSLYCADMIVYYCTECM